MIAPISRGSEDEMGVTLRVWIILSAIIKCHFTGRNKHWFKG